MGNIFSSDDDKDDFWHIHLEGPLPSKSTFKLSALCAKNVPAKVKITGPVSLDCTIQVENAVIVIDGNGHQVLVSGSNNVLTVNGSDIRIGIEGNENVVKRGSNGGGENVILYTDDEVDTNAIELSSKGPFKSPEAPTKLELQDEVKGDEPLDKEKFYVICITYRAKDSSEANNNNEVRSGDKRSADDEGEDSETKRAKND